MKSEGRISIGNTELEYKLAGPSPDKAPTILLLHEGLGCLGLWGDFPEKLSAATGAGVFAWSRAGYGQSSPADLPRKPYYMHQEALDVLPKLLDAINFRRGLLVGHSDGGSIATLYAGGIQDHRIRGVSLIAPHFVVEDKTVQSIAAIKETYAEGGLRSKLSRWHKDVDATFRGWNDIWLDPAFRRWDISESLGYIRVPIQIIQGTADEYGSERQIAIAEEECYCPVDATWLEAVGHAPHRDAPEATVKAIADFANRILHLHGEGEFAQAA